MDPSKAIGVILAGGRSARMGSDKALVDLNGRPMFRWVAAALEAADCRVVVAGGRQLNDLPGYPDLAGSVVGPLAGLLSTSRIAANASVVLAATDHPLLRSETVAALLDLEAPIVVPVDDGIAQVTCAVYRPVQIGGDMLAEADSIQDLITRVPARRVAPAEWRTWGEDGRSWFSVDTPDALAVAASWPGV
jgi:molybdopterin-guanine dinucleotide biosynthesis protein A